ncbi:MAG: C25 family cysteine peptidase [Candidatus Cloacimonadales bacterium]
MQKRLFLIFLLAISALSLLALQTIETGFATNTELVSNNNSGIIANFSFAQVEAFEVNTERGIFSNLQIANYSYTTEVGAPKLPALRKVIAVPFGAEVSAQLDNYELSETVIDGKVIPAQPSIAKCDNPEDIEFIYSAKAYEKRSYTASPVIRVEELGIMRGMQLYTLVFEPIKYNPTTNTIKVYNNVNVSVKYSGGDENLTAYKRAKNYSPYFEATFSQTLFNYRFDRDLMTTYPVSYIIISDPMFEEQLQPFIEWKTEKGFNVITGYTDEIGSSTTQIKSFIQEQYDNATPEQPAPSFVLFVGDVAQIPAYNGSEGSHVTDLNYVKLDGNDFLPEMYYGRFSANNTAELQPQIDKTLLHERFEMTDTSYLGEVVMIAGMDGSFGASHGNGAINYGTNHYFNESNGIESHTYLYPASGSNSANIISDVSNGVGYVNYTAHGSPTSWADPSFTISNINSLQNEDKYPLVVGNCCITNKFNEPTCFGEAWLRAEDKGAIAYIGGTNNTYWDEDYYWGVGAGPIVGGGATYEQTGLGVYDGLFHTHDEPFADWFTTAGGMIVNGNLAVTEGGSSRINYYWEIYSVMGDPSISAYLGVPAENNASYPTTILIGMSTIDIEADPYSYVSLTMDGEIYGTALIDESGSATLEFDPFTLPGNAKLVITAQNREPVIEIIEVIPNEGPYAVIENFAVNGTAAYNETFSFDLDLRNVGSDPATDVTATLSSTDQYITITENSLEVGDIAAETTESFNDVFQIEVASNVPNGHQAEFTLEMQGTEASWSGNMNVVLAAPAFEIGNMIIADSGNDGLLDAGETATISIPVSNIGAALSPAINTQIVTSTPQLITIDSASYDLDALASEEMAMAIFEISVAADAAEGSTAVLAFSLNAGAYSANNSYYPSIGLIFEDFESGDFSSMAWENGTPGWEIVTEAYEGDYAMKNASISHNQSTSISITMEVASDSEISFWKKVSSESNYDYLRFYINGSQQAEWSGDIAWSEEVFEVAAGENTFEWEYEKDGSVSNGSDCGWIDMITFPGGGTLVEQPIINLSTTEMDFGDVTPNETETETFTISNLGNAVLTGDIEINEDFSLDLDSFEILPGENVQIEVSFTPTEAIEYSGTVLITSNDENNPTLEIDLDGTGMGVSADEMIPLVTELQGNYPNPFNPTTTIRYALSSVENVNLEIYNIKGQKVKTLVNSEQEAGYHSVTWSGANNHNKQVASGIYFYKFQAGSTVSMRKMIMMK